MGFACRICNSEEYTEILGGMYKCNGCSVLFADTELFSIKDDVEQPVVKEDVPSRPMHQGVGLKFVGNSSIEPTISVPDTPGVQKQVWG